MFKKILVFGLVGVVAVGAAVSAYNVVAGPASGEQAGAVNRAQDTVPPIGGSDQASAVDNTPVGTPGAGVAAQGSGRQVGAAVQGSDWQSDTATQGNGQGKRYGQGGQGQSRGASQGAGTQTGVPNPQASQNESITLHGVVSNYAAPTFTLITDDGQSIAVQLGNQRFVTDLGIVLQEGDVVTLVGFYETSDSFAASTLTLDASGQIYTLRDQATGRPIWAGGSKQH